MSTATAPAPAIGGVRRFDSSRLSGLVRGKETDPRWVRPALIGLLALTAVAYVTDLSASGYANSFYAAAVEAGTRSWKAFFFGSFDSSNFITVDKPPASLWVMELFGRVFGFSSWSLLLPQALEGVACVGLVYATVRRRFSATAALLAGFAMMVTPVAVEMFRFDNPDALLVLLEVAATYCVVRAFESAAERAGSRWMALAGVAIGFAFLTKTLQAFLIVPGLAVVYLLFADATFRRRVFQVLVGGLALVISAGWWLAAVSLWPASSRPYIGGSQNNSEWNLIFGYNGFGRLTGHESGSVGGHATAGSSGMWGTTGITRLLGSEMGSQVSWLLPAALLLSLGAMWLWRRSGRTDERRAQLLLWLTWLIVTGLTFSYAKGIIHPYYTVALAPPIAALVGIGCAAVWEQRSSLVVRIFAAAVLGVSVLWAFDLLDRSPSWHPWIRWAALIVAVVAAAAIVAAPWITASLDERSWRGRSLGALAAATTALVALISILVAPAAVAANTARTPHSGAIPSAGPSQFNSDFLFSAGGGFGTFGGGPRPGGRPTATLSHVPSGFGQRPSGGFPSGGSTGGFPGGGPSGGFPSGGAPGGGVPSFGSPSTGGSTGTGPPGLFQGLQHRLNQATGGAAGGLLGSGHVNPALTKLLETDASSYSWIVAAVGADNAAGYQLATDDPVMAIGGFNGTDPAPSLAEFKVDVASDKIHYFVGGGSFGGFGPAAGGSTSSSDSSRITSWVEHHFTSRSIDDVTLYDLTSPKS